MLLTGVFLSHLLREHMAHQHAWSSRLACHDWRACLTHVYSDKHVFSCMISLLHNNVSMQLHALLRHFAGSSARQHLSVRLSGYLAVWMHLSVSLCQGNFEDCILS